MRATHGRMLFWAGLSLLFNPEADSAADMGTCEDCCQLDCLNSTIREAEFKKKGYSRLATKKKLTRKEYLQEADKLNQSAPRKTGCAWKSVDLKDPLTVRQFQKTHWTVTEVGDGNYQIDAHVDTDTEGCACRTNQDQLSWYKKLAPCAGIADAVESHEKTHVQQCEARKAKREECGSEKRPPYTTAQDEVEAHAAEIERLTLLRDAAQKACVKRSCADGKKSEAAADSIQKALPALK